LVETAAEVIEALGPAALAQGAGLRARLETIEATPDHESPARAQDPDYASLLAGLGDEPASLDELADRTGLAPAALSSMLLLLELEGVVAPAVNGRWQRLAAGRA